MTISTKQVFETIGIFAIVLSLLFLAFEMRQGNRIATAATEIEIRGLFAGINELVISNDELGDILLKVRTEDPNLSEKERMVFEFYLRRLLNTYLAIETAYENEMVPQETYDSVFVEIERLMISQTGVRNIWRELLESATALSERAYYVHGIQVLDRLEN